jgi:hypothetical protein
MSSIFFLERFGLSGQEWRQLIIYLKYFYDFVKSQNSIEFVIPLADAGSGPGFVGTMSGPGLRRGDASRGSLRDHDFSVVPL